MSSNPTNPTSTLEQPAAAKQIASQATPLEPLFDPLPAEPLVTIQPSTSWVALDLRQLWAFRELLYFLTWRDIKVRYKQTALGAAWAVLQPVFMMLIFTLFFGRLAGVSSHGIPYPLFALAGLVPWTFFANSVTGSSNSLVGSAHLITKVYFPRLLVPTAAVMAGLADFALAFGVLAGLMIYYRVQWTWQILLVVPLLVLTMLLALGVGLWLSALNVRYRDVRFALPFLIQAWLFISSVIVPSSSVPERWRWILVLNPVSATIEGYRSALFGLPIHWTALGVSVGMTAFILIYAAYSFKRMEKSFADII